jgi:hypothetical protein
MAEREKEGFLVKPVLLEIREMVVQGKITL